MGAHKIDIDTDKRQRATRNKEMAKEPRKINAVLLVALVSLFFTASTIVYIVGGISVGGIGGGSNLHEKIPKQPFDDLTAQDLDIGTGREVKLHDKIKVKSFSLPLSLSLS